LVRGDATAAKDTSQQPQADHPAPAAAGVHDITPLSIGKRIITRDKRFRVHHQPPAKWTLSIDNVGPSDDKAYYLCQISGGGGGGGHSTAGSARGQPPLPSSEPAALAASSSGPSFFGGARLNVLGE
jgi:hypothetical protein